MRSLRLLAFVVLLCGQLDLLGPSAAAQAPFLRAPQTKAVQPSRASSTALGELKPRPAQSVATGPAATPSMRYPAAYLKPNPALQAAPALPPGATAADDTVRLVSYYQPDTTAGGAQRIETAFASAPATAASPASNGCEPLPPVDNQVAPASYQDGGSFVTALQPGSPVLDPNQAGNLRNRIDPNDSAVTGDGGGSPVLDPNQIGNLGTRLGAVEQQLQSSGKPSLPLIRLSGFMQLDQAFFSQSTPSFERLGNIENGVGFRRTRLQAIGKLTEHTGLSIEMDFATIGRPSFMDVWGEQSELPFFGTIRIGQFRQPGTMDAWTSIRHLEFLERSLPFQSQDPFRRVGIMAYALSEDELTQWAYSVYATGLTFFNGTETVYSTLGDTRAGTQIGDSGGVSFSGRVTHLLYYDEPSDGRYLVHIGGGYNYSGIGGAGTTGPFAKTYNARPVPEFFVGDPAGGGLTIAGDPVVVDSGRIVANSFNFWHTELAANWGAAHFQSEFMATTVNQRGGPAIFYPGAYFQCGYFLTGESCLYLKQAGVLDYNVVPYADFFGLGRNRGFGGWGAWEVAFRWSWQDLSGVNINPANQLSNSAGPPPAPNPGVVNQTTLAINWWWNKFTRLQFNWIHSMPNYRGFGNAPFDIYAARFQVEF